MVSINYATRDVTCKIVYYGPGLSGKTTNLIYVHKKVPPTTRGKMISLATEADRTLYFDFLPINIGTINGFAAKFQLYTVPGQVYYNATRKLVLRGTDGIVFVADSQAEKMDENIESLTNLKENLAEYGYDINEIPVVIQYNKRDLPGVLSVAELEAKLNPTGWKYFEAEAVSGRGVFDTLKMIIKVVLEKAKSSKSTAVPAKENVANQEKAEIEVAAVSGQMASETSPPPAMAASLPQMAAPIPSSPSVEGASPTRRPAYTAAESTEEENDYKPEDSLEYNTLKEEKIPGQPEPMIQMTDRPADEIPASPVTEAASEEHAARPFPGSTSSRILRRERRITVSDFQPASREEEGPSFRSRLTAEDNKHDLAFNSGLPAPSMAPSKRLIRKKQGFFKRLFGIK
jgi:signal recognition particle receptor subunit beta